MKGDEKVIEYLNRALRSELTAVHQYTLNARLLEDWGLTKLSAKQEQETQEEMGHANRCIERILFLGGKPNVQDMDTVRVGGNVKEIMECDLAAESEAITLYREAMGHCESVRDYASRDLFGALLVDEEGHYDFLETQLDLIERLGIQNYEQSAMGSGQTE
ncbi:bacterioferritin [Aquisalimonas asiatica]|uniref:Bacterioferritin n=1 Tax=Aquisalimonas asiatica TaxID=406100 RepID=A0A1H8V0R4_9GAMM|nr:bacterioferritin [Aquisalimonas asiatica]SEP09090.1 bacterioferritin [Aquisalimonas asiatica]